MAWYNPAWQYALPVTVTNGSSTSALSYAQVAFTLTGSAYTSITTHGQAGLADIVVTDSDGVTTLPFALEGIDSTNSIIYLVVKVSLAANTNKTIYVYYGNPLASSTSSYSGAITPQVALVGPTDIVTQSGTNPSSGYNSNPTTILLKNQGGAHGGGSGLNGDILSFFIKGALDNGGANASIGKLRCPAGSDPSVATNWTLSTVLAPAASHGAVILAAGEMSDGRILIAYKYDTNTNVEASTCSMYIGKSTDGSSTWTNVSTSPTNLLSLPTGGVAGTTVGIYWGQFLQDASNNIYINYYGKPGSDTTFSAYLMQCLAANEPTTGSNFSQFAVIARDGSQVLNYEEPDIIQVTATSWLCVMRNEGSSPNTGDLYVTRTTNSGSTWAAPAALGLPDAALAGTSSSAVAPWLMNLASGNILLQWGNRNINSVEGGATTYGNLLALSTNSGTSFFDRYFAEPVGLPLSSGNRVDFGVGSTVQQANGNIVLLSMRSIVATTQTNIVVSIFTEDWVANSGNTYHNCEATTGGVGQATTWTLGATASADATHVHNGTKSIKMDNSAGLGSYGYLTAWQNPVRQPGNYAASIWSYATQIATRGCHLGFSDGFQTNRLSNVSVDATPYHAVWYNGTAYQDTGKVAGINAWYKLTENFSVSGNLGTILVNDVSATTSQTHWGTGSPVKIIEPFAYADTSGGQSVTWWVDDVQVYQYLPAQPTFSVGAELVGFQPYIYCDQIESNSQG